MEAQKTFALQGVYNFMNFSGYFEFWLQVAAEGVAAHPIVH